MKIRGILLWHSILASCNLVLIFREGINALGDAIPLQTLQKVSQPCR